MSEDKNRVTPKDAKELVELQKSVLLEQQQKLAQETIENKEEFVEMKFLVPLSLSGKLSNYYAKIYKEWQDEEA